MADFFRQKETIEDTIAFLQESTQTLVEFHANIVGGELTNRDEELGTRLKIPSPPPPFHLPRVCGSLDGGAFCECNTEQREATEQIVDQCSKRATQAKVSLDARRCPCVQTAL